MKNINSSGLIVDSPGGYYIRICDWAGACRHWLYLSYTAIKTAFFHPNHEPL